jgi:hypothetical protein
MGAIRNFQTVSPRGTYPVPHPKRTSRAPSPNTAWKRSSGGFVFWDLHREPELPEIRSGEQTSADLNFLGTWVNKGQLTSR